MEFRKAYEPKEVANICGVCAESVYVWIRTGKLKATVASEIAIRPVYTVDGDDFKRFYLERLENSKNKKHFRKG